MTKLYDPSIYQPLILFKFGVDETGWWGRRALCNFLCEILDIFELSERSVNEFCLHYEHDGAQLMCVLQFVCLGENITRE